MVFFFSGDLVFLLLLLRLSMCMPKVNSNENNVNANWCNLILCIYLKIVQPWRPGWARAIWSDDVNIVRFCANWRVNLREHWLWAAHLEFNMVQRSVGGHWAASQVQLLDQVVQLHCALKYFIANWIACALLWVVLGWQPGHNPGNTKRSMGGASQVSAVQ